MFKAFKENKFLQFVMGIVFAWVLFLLFFFLVPFFGIDKPTKFAELGDAFGVFNALFSALAFAGVIYTILLQRDELELQRKELELQRKQMQRSNEIQQTMFMHERTSTLTESLNQALKIENQEVQTMFVDVVQTELKALKKVQEKFKRWEQEDAKTSKS